MSNFTVYRASAGSGKTFSLVIEYLTIALADASGKNYRKILGVTFTNKASGELKERIIKFLKGVSLPADNPGHNAIVSAMLCERLSISERELQKRAARTLTDILHNYSRLSISTIDKFVHRLIRSFARELKLQGDFEIEMDSERVFHKVAQRVISLVGKDEQLTGWIIRWLIGRLEENSGTGDYEKKLVGFLGNLSTDEAAPFKEKLVKLSLEDMSTAQKKLDAETAGFEKQVWELGARGWNLISSAGLSVDDFSQKDKGSAGYFRKMADKVPESYLPNAYVVKQFESGKLYSGKGSSAVEAITPGLSDIYYEIQQLVESGLKTYKLAVLLRKELYVLGLAGRLEEILRSYLDEKNLVLISDFNKKIAEVVINEPAPFIYELLGERYDHFLIDEFQDTSVLQWQNFLPLVDNSLGKGGKTLIVGDGKQSIYRFRGGEVEQFQRLPEIFQGPGSLLFNQYESALKRNNRIITIEQNYRSTVNVVNFNNDFIDSLPAFLTERYLPVFGDGKQLPVLKEEGYVFVKAFDKDPEQDLDRQNLDQLLNDIERLKNSGYDYRDCCVLVMKNSSGTMVAQELLANNIPIISEDSLVVLFSRKTRLLLGCLQLLCDPADARGQLNVIENAISLGLLEGDALTLFRKYCRKNEDKRGLICNTEWLFRDLKIYEKHETLLIKDLYSLSEFLARTLGFMNQYDPFVQFFLDQNLSCMLKEGNNLKECVKWWDENAHQAKVAMPEGLDAVRIMTIHKSKGLEFENVLIPFVHWQGQPTKKVLWLDPGEVAAPLQVALVPNSASALKNTGFEALNELETEKDKLDEANKMYVALTRAAQNLFVYTGPAFRKTGIASHFYDWIQSREDFSEEKRTVELGALKIKSAGHKTVAKSDALKIKTVVSNYDERKLIIGYQAPKFWDADNPSTERDHGNIVHELLTSIHSSKDLDPVIEKHYRTGTFRESEQ
ncbi:MAG: UvrD-helicase domain-containing protein, partial [Bacteroidota bacterium]